MAKAWFPFDTSILYQIFGICHSLRKRLEADDPMVRNGGSVEIVDGTRVERLVSPRALRVTNRRNPASIVRALQREDT